jgi:hypothetical protein
MKNLFESNCKPFFLNRSLNGYLTANLIQLSFAGLLISFFNPGKTLAIPPKSITNGTAFAQLSSKLDQDPGGFVQLESKDSLQRITATNNSVTLQQSGSYLIIASPQVTATKDGGYLDAWIVVNGQDVKNSGVRISHGKTGDTNVVVSQVIMNLKKGDKIQVKSNGKDSKLDAISANNAPLIPSIIFTVVGLD